MPHKRILPLLVILFFTALVIPAFADVTDGLVAYWKADGDAADSAGSYGGTPANGATFSTGKVGQAFSLDGLDDYVSVPNGIVPATQRNFTIAAWVYADSVAAASENHVFYSSPTNGGEFFFANKNGEFQLGLYLSNNSWYLLGTTAETGRWVHLVGVRRGTQTEMWVDGELVNSRTIPDLDMITGKTGFNSCIGAYNQSDKFWDGLIDELRIYDRALSDAEIKQVMSEGLDQTPDAFVFTDQTGVPFNSTIESNPITVTGIEYYAPVTVAGGEFAISTDNGSTWGGWTTDPGTVGLNDQVKVRVVSAAGNNATTTATLTIGGVSDGFSVTTSGTTHVLGTISVDTVWGPADGTYVVDGALSVAAGKTLTIQEGTVVKFVDHIVLRIYGTLNAAGTAASPIYFTSLSDDSVGGDTNGDGTATSPTAGVWSGIYVDDGGSASITYGSIRYGGYSLGIANVLKTKNGTLTMDHCTLGESSGYGINISNAPGTVSITNSTIGSSGKSGIISLNSTPSIAGNTIGGNSEYGLYVDATALPASVTANNLDGNVIGPVGVTPNASGVVIDDDNVFSGPIIVTGGTITLDTAWSNRRVYLINGNLYVAAGKTLTIQPGIVVKFVDHTVLRFYGALSAPGTAALPIYFTSLSDDSAGGDTNGDGTATTPAPGAWSGIYVDDGGSASITYGSIRYGGYSLGAANVLKTKNGTLTLDHCTSGQSSGYGINLSNASGTVSITDSTISGNGKSGIISLNSTPSISGNLISGNVEYGLYVDGPALPASVTGNTLDGNTIGPVGATANGSGVVIAVDNTFSGPIIVLTGTITQDTAWSNRRVYRMNGNLSVAAGTVLTISNGPVIKSSGRAGLMVSGSLNAQGTAELPIYFTEIQDDSVGGDTNGDGTATTPAAGAWPGIIVNDNASATLTYSTVRYGGYSYGYSNVMKSGNGQFALDHCTAEHSSGYGVNISNATGVVSVADSTISSNATSGIVIVSSSPSISGNTISSNNSHGINISGATAAPSIVRNRIHDNPVGILCASSANPLIGGSVANGNDIYANTSYGVQNSSSDVTVAALYNWWGNASGPTHASNPAGTGDRVSDYVDFSNFLPYWATYVYTLTLDVTGTGGGTVTVPALALTCNAACTAQVHRGDALDVQEQANVDALFAGWSGGICSGTGACSFTMDGDTAVTATFTAVPPTADFTAAPLTGYEPLVVAFTDLSTHAPLAWQWSFGDSGSSTKQHPTHLYEVASAYTVSLKASNANGDDTRTAVGFITVSTCPNGPASILPSFYPTVQDAYDNAADGSEIRFRHATLAEGVILDRTLTVDFDGGYDCVHGDVVGRTALTGSMQIRNGTVIVRNIVIR